MQINQFEKTYDNFDSNSYIKEYYLELNEELKFSLNFFHKVYSKFNSKNKLKLLEIGGGPTIYQLISASLVVDEIIFSDYLENNRLEVKKWIEGQKGVFNWEEYFEYVAYLNRDRKDLNAQKLKELLKSKIKLITHCNVYSENPLHPLNKSYFDIVSINFCLEGITNNEKNFLSSLKNSLSLLKGNGILIMSMLKNVDFYKVGNLKYHVFSIDEEYIKNALTNLGFTNIEINIFNGTDFSYGEYHKEAGTISLVATKSR